jgi:hypothetical protein
MTHPSKRRTLVTATTAAVIALSAALPLTACRAATGLAQVDVYDRAAGETLVEYRHRGQRYVVGQPGNEYAVRIRNRSDQRVLAVVSVDGINAVTGESASPTQSGYVLEPGGYVNIQGWRKDMDRTAAFYFSDPGDSYAARTGRPNDLGVIGVALFRERFAEPDVWMSEQARAGTAAPQKHAETSAAAGAAESRHRAADATAPSSSRPSLGTGHGRGEYSPVRRVAFERASQRPDETITIRYDRREALVARGVIPRPWYSHSQRESDPFPGASGFVPDP